MNNLATLVVTCDLTKAADSPMVKNRLNGESVNVSFESADHQIAC
jgi:hypothetical protein